MGKHKVLNFTRETFAEAVAASQTALEVFRRLDIKISNRTLYRRFKHFVELWEIDTSHFLGSKAFLVDRTKTLDQYLVLSDQIPNSYYLKEKLYEAGVFKRECCVCHLTEWMGAEIPLELNHLDSNRKNNVVTNLRIICHNCRASEELQKEKKGLTPSLCCDCGKRIGFMATRCIPCARKFNTRGPEIPWPPMSSLHESLRTMTHYALAKKLGVTIGGLKHHLKTHSVFAIDI